MSQNGEISLCTQILQNSISPSVGLLIYYCGLCQQGFMSEAEVNKHISQHFTSVKCESTPPSSNPPPNPPTPEEVPVHPETASSEDEKENTQIPLGTAVQQQQQQQQQVLPTPANNTYYILIPQSQGANQQPNTIYINGSGNLTEDNTAITLAVNNQTLPGVQQQSNGTTLYQIIQEPQTVTLDRPTTADDSNLTDRKMSTSSSEHQIPENGRHNSEPQLFTLPQVDNSRVLVTELPIGTQHSSQLALLPQDSTKVQTPNFRMGYSSQMSGHFKKRHVCDICNRAFTQRGSLKYHRMLHTGEKPFQCNVCNKSFRIRAPYDAHMDVHNGVRYRCSICLKYYSSRATLRQHLKGQHPNMSHPPISSCGFQCSSINLATDDVDSAIKQ